MSTPKTPEELAAEAAAATAAASSTEHQSFDDAFAEITADEGAKPKTPEELAAEAAAAKKTTAEEDPNAVAAAAAAGGTTEEDPAAAAAAAATAAATAASDPAAELAAARAEIEALKAAAKAAPAATAADGNTTAATTADGKPAEEKIQWYTPTEQEKAIIDQHAKDWPDINAAQAVITKAAVYNAMQYIFAELKRTYNPVLDRFHEVSEALEGQLALTEIRGKNNDYDAIRDKVVAWVDTLPAYVKNSAKQIMETGTPEEVSEIIADYRKANPAAAAATAAAAAATTNAPAAKQTELTAAAKKAAGKLTVVDSKRTTQAAAPDQNDYDAAWKEASAAS